jgi:RNAse (barnase) inhibitor barstar
LNALAALLKDSKHAGVYRVHGAAGVKEIEKHAKAAGMAFFQLEGQKISKKEQFLNHASLAMHFPEHFGNNWDAFEDCLTDLSWVDEEGYVIFYDHFGSFAEHAPSQFETALEVFKSAVESWREQNKPMFVLLRGESDAELDVKTLKL